MKRLTVCRLSALLLLLLCAVANQTTAQIFIPKRNNVFNLNLEMHATFNTFFTDSRFDEAAFRFNQIKLEASGEVNDWLFYWYRQSLNQGGQTMEIENLPESIEYALVGFNLSDKFTLTAGKQPVDFGGFEYDLNPLEIYEYSDMNEYTSCYFTGISLAYQMTPSQELRLQATNNRLGSMEETYGLLPKGIEKSKVPLYYTANWNSSYFDELLNLRYSITAGEQAKGKWVYVGWAGQQVSMGSFDMYFDAMYMRGALDQLGLLTELTEPEMTTEAEANPCAQHTEYLSLVAEMNYRFHPKWNLFVKGMYETASIYKDSEFYDKGKYRTAWGYQGGIAFYPMADENLHIFITGIGRSYSLAERIIESGGGIDNTARLSVGFIYKLPLF